MDCFLAEGIEVIFRLALALLLLAKHELLMLDMEGVIRVSRNIEQRNENCSTYLQEKCWPLIFLRTLSRFFPSQKFILQ